MAAIVIENGRLVDPGQSRDEITSICLADGKVAWVGAGAVPEGAQRIDASGMIVTPGLIDMHVHLREPGGEEDETIDTGTLAAIHGGFTSIACCPNTLPPLDSQASVELVRQLALRADHCNVFPLCCISKGRAGEELAELGILFEAGAVACTDDGAGVSDSELMRRAMEYVLMFDRPILSHAESMPLDKEGVMHEGRVSMELGLRGMPAAAEEVMVARDITLAQSTGARLHIMHVSTEGAVSAIRRAKQRGVRVTAEVTPHHLTLLDEELHSFSSNFKMNPPLRSAEHVAACIEGLRDGTIDCIATDHAPHSAEKKLREITIAPFGIVGLETALPLMIESLIEKQILTWPQLIEKMSTNPARVLSLPGKGTLAAGSDADVTIIDPKASWLLTEEQLHSKSKNSPWLGKTMTGRAAAVIVGGKVKYSRL